MTAGRAILAAALVLAGAALPSRPAPAAHGSFVLPLAGDVARLPPLRVEGRHFVRADGQPFVWRFVTAFRLVDLVADGRDADAIAFLDWAAATGFSGVRVLTTLCCWFQLDPAAGQRALPRLLDLAAARGLYVEAVALAGTGEDEARLTRDQMRRHVKAVGAACAAAENCVVALANENDHGSQADDLVDPAFLRELDGLVPSRVPVAWGPPCCSETDDSPSTWLFDHAAGDYLTIHLSRVPDKWDQIARLKLLDDYARRFRKPVVDDENIGAGERDEPRRRSADPAVFFAQGILARITGAGGSTFHFDDGLHARVPARESRQQAAAHAFIEGSRLVPDAWTLAFHEAGEPSSPVAQAAPSRVVSVYAGVRGGRGWMAALGVSGDPGLVMQNGWRIHALAAERAGITVWEIRK